MAERHRRVSARRRIDLGDRHATIPSRTSCSSARAIRVPITTAPCAKATTCIRASVVALDADTGQLKWHFQFTPHDVHDWDSTQVPVLADLTINNQPRKTMLFANRNGFFYVLDRTNGRMILAKPFVTQTWAKEISPEGRPILLPGYHAHRGG